MFPVQRGAAHDLDVEVPLVEHPLGRFTDGGESLGEDVVERLAVGQALGEDVGLCTEFGVGEGGDVVFEARDLLGDDLQLAQDLAFAGTEDLVEEAGHGYLSGVGGVTD